MQNCKFCRGEISPQDIESGVADEKVHFGCVEPGKEEETKGRTTFKYEEVIEKENDKEF